MNRTQDNGSLASLSDFPFEESEYTELVRAIQSKIKELETEIRGLESERDRNNLIAGACRTLLSQEASANSQKPKSSQSVTFSKIWEGIGGDCGNSHALTQIAGLQSQLEQYKIYLSELQTMYATRG